jgi:ribosomal protein S18 acetylase RimI-like enzyme
MATELGYRYTYPEDVDPERGTVSVMLTDTTHNGLDEAALAYQGIMNAAFNAQYGHFRAEDIAQTANPRSRALVHSQVVKLMSAKSEHALYLEARLDMPDEPNKVVGFSKVKFADGRSRLRRMVDTDEEDARNLADVSDTYVNPAQQGHFVGTMLLHSGLDAFPVISVRSSTNILAKIHESGIRWKPISSCPENTVLEQSENLDTK